MQRTCLRAKESRGPIHLPPSHEDRGRTSTIEISQFRLSYILQRAAGAMRREREKGREKKKIYDTFRI